jgi:hypothetical protein
MHALTKLLFDLSQFAPHALADRQAPHRESPQSVLPADASAGLASMVHAGCWISGEGGILQIVDNPAQLTQSSSCLRALRR